MDLVQSTGGGEDITLAGKSYAIRLLTLREWGQLQSWLKRECQSPVTRAYIAIQQSKDAGTPLSRDIEDRILDRAERAALKWPPRLGSDHWFDALASVDGGDARLLYEVVSKVDPAFTIESAEALCPQVKDDEWADLIRVSLFGSHPRPKGDGPAA